MSNPPDRPWTEEEKNALLTEILKKDGIPSNFLFRLINENNILPKWTEIPLPPGRSLSSCQMAFNQMHQAHVPDHQRPPQLFRPDSSSSAHISPYHGPSISRKRPIQPLEKSTPGTPRAIQPKPPLSGGGRFNGGGGGDGSSNPGVQMSPGFENSMAEPPRKRGRPSKVETQRRMAEAQARGEQYPPPKRKPVPRPRNRPAPELSSSTTGDTSGGGQGSRFSLLPAPDIEGPRSDTRYGEPSGRRIGDQIEMAASGEQTREGQGQSLRPGTTVGSSPRTRLEQGQGMYPPTNQGIGPGGHEESGPLSTPRTILASQKAAPAVPYGPSFRGVNEVASNTSTTQGTGSPNRLAPSPVITKAGETVPSNNGGGQSFQLLPGSGGGSARGVGGGGGGAGGKKT